MPIQLESPGSREQQPFSRITLEQVVKRALHDLQNKEVAEWLRAPRETYPTREELANIGLTELNYLTLQTNTEVPGLLRSFPGGIASPLAVEILKEDILKRKEKGIKGTVTVLALLHGAIMPNPQKVDDTKYDGTGSKVVNEKLKDCKARAFHMHDAYTLTHRGSELQHEMCCGVGGGNSLNTREQADENVVTLKKWAKEQGIDINVVLAEAIIPIDTNIPYFRIYKESAAKESEDNYRLSAQNDPCKYPVEELLSISQFNDQLREYMDRGKPIAGIACSDARNGTLYSPYAELDLHKIYEQVGDGKVKKAIFGTNGVRYDYEGAGHTETFAVPLIDGDFQMLSLALYLTTNPQVLQKNRRAAHYLSHGRPFLINISPEFLASHASEIHRSLEPLITELDNEVYRPFLNSRPVRYFIQHGGQIEEVIAPLGMQMLLPQGKSGDILDKIRPGIPYYTKIKPRVSTEMPIYFNPAIEYDFPPVETTYTDNFSIQRKPLIIPGTRRKIGQRITNT